MKAAGAQWVQLDEPTIVLDLEAHKLDAFKHAYSTLGPQLPDIKVLIETYFADLPVAAYKYVFISFPCYYYTVHHLQNFSLRLEIVSLVA